jgi:cyclopropane fatty-acyl-phospholipid synthase-like methyltransferase
VTSTEFWARNQVGGPYRNITESAQGLRARLRMYPDLLDLMPVNHPGKTVLDFGCGPGHDTILMAQLGADVHYTDISPLAEQITLDRLNMHGLSARRVPKFETYDHIHCAGVLHHINQPVPVLERFAGMLNPDGEISLMVYDGHKSTHSQSEVPVTHWWDETDVWHMAQSLGLTSGYLGSYECSSEWRPNCWAACYRLWASA